MALFQIIEDIVLKVVNVKKPRFIFAKSGGSLKKSIVQSVIAKDVHGMKTTISLWRDFVDRPKEGHVYRFSKLEVGKYPATKPHNLTTRFTTRISDVTNDHAEAFKEIGKADGKVTGRVLGISSLTEYKSCVNCWVKIEDDKMGCTLCTDPSKVKFFNDYRCQFQVERGEEELIFTGFRRNMGLTGDVNETTEDELNLLYAGEMVEVEFEINRRQNENVKIVHAIKIQNA